MGKRITISGTAAAASLTGLLSNATGATWTLTANAAGDDLAHLITIRNDTANDHSAKTAVLTGTGPNGESQEETVNLPAGSATVTSTQYFLTLTSIVPSATIGADTMDIGWAVTAVSAWHALNINSPQFHVGFGCSVESGSPNYGVQHSYGDAAVFDHATVTSETTNQYGEYLAPVQSIRLRWTVAGGVKLNAIQGGV